MTPDTSPDPAADPLVSRPRRHPRPVLLAGVLVACLGGGALGFWARPEGGQDLLARPPLPAPPAPAAPRRIEIHVEGQARLAPAAPAPDASPAAPQAARSLAPQAPPPGLVRVRAVAPAHLAAAPRTPPGPPPAERPAAVRKAAPEPARRAQAAKGAERRPAKAKARPPAREAAAARRAAEQAAGRKARAEQARLAAARARAERRAEQAARAREEARAAARRRQARAAPKTSARPAGGEGPLRVAGAHARCAFGDPGAALACADPSLGAAERQLDRAYRAAEAAGVSPERLRRQQQRWLAARAAAARQAPWAVHDVYLARIAELQDQARSASELADGD
jgi:hypothetical protein